MPTFASVGPFCSGANIPTLPTTSQNGYTGTWSPAINNSATTTYTFTPSAGQCATAANMTIVIDPNITPTFTQVGPFCSGANIAALPTTSNNGITGAWAPAINNTATTTYTFTPTAGLCATTQTMTITIDPNITPTFNPSGPYCAGANIPVLPTTSKNAITGTWSPAINNNSTTTYTFTPTAGQCATNQTLTITVNANITPTFSAAGPYCAGANIPALPNTSNNNFTGSWAPAINNNATSTYTFTPSAGQCATTTTLEIVVNPNITPTFTQVGPYCAGASISALPTTSNNGYDGTWSPAINNNATTTCTFTPAPGLCATTATQTITVNPNITPTFDAVGPYCSGGNIPDLPTTSLNGYTGTWSPAINNGQTTTYTYSPTPGLCATQTNTTIVVNSPSQSVTNVTVCANTLPYQWNGQTMNNAGQFEANFTNSQGCDSIAILNLTVSPVLTSTTNVQICQNQAPYYWNGLSLTSTGTHTLTLSSSLGCDSLATLNLVVNPMPVVSFTANYEAGCAPLNVAFTSTSSNPNSTCQWNFGNGVVINGCGPVSSTYNSYGCYDVTLQVTSSNGCVTSLTQDDLVCVNPQPIASFVVNPQQLTNVESTANFTNTSSGHESSHWTFGDGSGTSTQENPSHIYPEDAGYYYATLIVANSHGCTDTATQLVIVENQVIFYVPNTFTPDGDLFNPDFLPIFTAGFDIYNYNLVIFNRWGEIVFESNDALFGWDGTYGGMPCPDGTYIWQIKYKEFSKDKD
jgi:gliding motility-associated-like protein